MKKIFLTIFLIAIVILFVVVSMNFDYLRLLGRFLTGACGLKSSDAGELNSLRSENIFLKSQLEEIKSIKKENDFLKDFFNLPKPLNFRYVLADVVVRSPFNFSPDFTINQGEEAGLKNGDAVVWLGKVLVGTVSRAEKNFSVVNTLFDESTKINVLIGEKSLGLLRGNRSKIVVDSIDKDDKINKGDSVAVSALTNDYPKGLIVGEIEEIIDNPQEHFKKAVVKVPYNWIEIERVMVLTK